MCDVVGVHIVHRCLDFFQRGVEVPPGGESDELVLVTEALQDKIQDARIYGTLTDMLKLVPLLEHLDKVFIGVLIWHHDHAVQFVHQNTPPMY